MLFGFVAGAAFEDQPLWVRYSVGMAPGVFKEAMDARSGGTGFSGKDLAVDFLGVVAGEYLGGLMIKKTHDTVTIGYQTRF
jgi:uncharacterized protein YfiM (DUF2279 family)